MAERKEVPFTLLPTKVGQQVLLYGKPTSVFPFQMLVGPDWPCLSYTYTAILAPSVCFAVLLAPYYGPWMIVGAVLSMLVVLLSLSLVRISVVSLVCPVPGCGVVRCALRREGCPCFSVSPCLCVSVSTSLCCKEIVWSRWGSGCLTLSQTPWAAGAVDVGLGQ